MNISDVYANVRREVIGREDETQLILAALAAGRDLLLEGPPGTSKSTILRAITGADHTPFHFVEGNADLTPAKLLGHHSPARVLEEGYTEENFMPGPLPLAMAEGGFLYIEEFNRVPEDTLNALISAMAEREVAIPRAGRVRARDGFRLIAAMNPFDNIGTERLSGAVADRLCRVRMDYQSAELEREIVARKTGSDDSFLTRLAVEAARRSRAHPDLRSGASVRAAIDFVLVAEKLAVLRGADLPDTRNPDTRWTLVNAARTAFSIKVKVRESSNRPADEVVAEIILEILDEDGGPEGPEEGPVSGESPPEDPGRGPGDERGRGSNAGSSPALSGLLAGGGQIYSSGEEAAEATAGRNRGGRMFRGFAEVHSGLADRLDEEGATLAVLEGALREEEGGDGFEALGEMLDLYDRADLRALARRLAGELVIRQARRNAGARSGKGKLSSVRFRGDAGELDLERTVETLIEKPRPADEDLFVFERRRRRRSYALMLDVSGSMKGSSIFHAALALASVAASVERSGDSFAVVAFWREAAMLKRLHEEVETNTLLDRLFSLTGRGLTDLGLGLRAGLEELAGADTQERVGILFGDGLQTAGEPAAPFAAAFPTLHVLATGDSEESLESCRALAALGHGRCAEVRRAAGIPAAVNACLAA